MGSVVSGTAGIPGAKTEVDEARPDSEEQLDAAAAARARGQCSTAANLYQAFINELLAQSGKGVDPAAAYESEKSKCQKTWVPFFAGLSQPCCCL
jgi:hypothetical protein